MVFFGRLVVGLLLVGVGAQSPDVSYAPEDCLEVTVEACAGLEFEIMVSGVYVPYDGPCGNMGGRQAYYNTLTEQYLYFVVTNGVNNGWRINSSCGLWSQLAASDVGHDALFPFVGTRAKWYCAPDGAYLTVSIECTLYDGQSVPCESGSYDVTGIASAAIGECSDKCPSHLPASKPGSTTIGDCFTVITNLFVLSDALNRIVALNADAKDYQLIKEGGAVDRPADFEFVGTQLFVSMWQKDKVIAFNVEGEVLYTFAIVSGPEGILFLPELNLVAIASSTDWKTVFFFDTSAKDTVEPLQMSAAVGVLYMSDVNAGFPLCLSRGGNHDEVSTLSSQATPKDVRTNPPPNPPRSSSPRSTTRWSACVSRRRAVRRIVE